MTKQFAHISEFRKKSISGTQGAIFSPRMIGIKTLYHKEVLRFLKVWNQTITAPAITTLLFLAIFNLALGGNTKIVQGVPFNEFIAPGLIMMAVVQNAFANTSSSLMLAKIQGVIIDLIMPPFKAVDITISLALAGITRGIIVGLSVGFAIWIFVPISIHSFGVVIFYTVAASLMLALIGIIAGLWSQSFDQIAAVTNYVVSPLAFLSGTFYSIASLPGIWYDVVHINPFFYMIDGIRYGFTGYSDTPIITGIVVLCFSNIVLWCVTVRLIRKGYKLKS
jgi:ABC-2 type transport system permease protein